MDSGFTLFQSPLVQLPSRHQPTRPLRLSLSLSLVEVLRDLPMLDSTNLVFQIISSRDKVGIRKVERRVELRAFLLILLRGLELN